MNTMGQRIKNIRGERTRDLFASMLEVSKTTIFNYEKGTHSPDANFLNKILSIHPDINPLWLLTGEGEMEKDKAPRGGVTASEVDRSLLEAIISAVEEHLQTIRKTLPPKKKSQLVTTLYDLFICKEDKKVDKAVVISLVMLAV